MTRKALPVVMSLGMLTAIVCILNVDWYFLGEAQPPQVPNLDHNEIFVSLSLNDKDTYAIHKLESSCGEIDEVSGRVRLDSNSWNVPQRRPLKFARPKKATGPTCEILVSVLRRSWFSPGYKAVQLSHCLVRLEKNEMVWRCKIVQPKSPGTYLLCVQYRAEGPDDIPFGEPFSKDAFLCSKLLRIK